MEAQIPDLHTRLTENGNPVPPKEGRQEVAQQALIGCNALSAFLTFPFGDSKQKISTTDKQKAKLVNYLGHTLMLGAQAGHTLILGAETMTFLSCFKIGDALGCATPARSRACYRSPVDVCITKH